MTISGIDENEFRVILRNYLTPSASIKTPERLFGREKNLNLISRTFNSEGRQIFIYGDRGVGKTSLAVTAASIHTSKSRKHIYVVCDNDSTFFGIIQSIGHKSVKVEDRINKPASGRSGGFSILGTGVNLNLGTPLSTSIPLPTTINDAIDIIGYVSSRGTGRLVIIIDEMERIQQVSERNKFAEFIKNIGEIEVDVRFIFCGIASDVTELIGHHPSAGRILEPIALERLKHSDLWQIINSTAKKLNILVQREALIRISQISDGFPHFVHLIGESMFWAMFTDTKILSVSRSEDFNEGIHGALVSAEPALKAQYDKATKKTKLSEDYEEVLWALADTTSDSRQLSEIFDHSYRRIMHSRPRRTELSRERFNQRLLSLRGEGHGNIVAWSGAGWFGFREKMMRGYARLKAQQAGIELGRDTS